MSAILEAFSEKLAPASNHYALIAAFGASRHAGNEFTFVRRGITDISTRARWTSAVIPFSLFGRRHFAGGMWRTYVGEDWLATMFARDLGGGHYVTTPLRIRGNRQAAEEALVAAYLEHI